MNYSETNINNELADQKIHLQLGDIVKIEDPIDENLNNQIFYIQYIDKKNIQFVNTDNLSQINLPINEDGIIGNGTIQKLFILSRAENESYAKQNNFIPGKWIDIHFGGDYPSIITANIINLEEDMIEIKTIDGEILYINFDYKGIPEDLPIDKIILRNPPPSDSTLDETPDETENVENIENVENVENIIKENTYQAPETTRFVEDQIREVILKADQIRIGTQNLGSITTQVDVQDKFKKYSIEEQQNDLLDDLLSSIPSANRTQKVLNNLHKIINRYTQLREKFSIFNEYGNVVGPLVYESRYKPLLKYFEKFDINLYWILPVVKNIKKIYENKDIESDNTTDTGFELLNLEDELLNMKEDINSFSSNNYRIQDNKYYELYNEINQYFTPFSYLNNESKFDIIAEKSTNENINVLFNDMEDLYTTTISNNNLNNYRFFVSKLNTGLKHLVTESSSGSKLIARYENLTPNDTLSLKSIITLPEPIIKFSNINLPNTNLLDKSFYNTKFVEYWAFLSKKTKLNNIIIENTDKDFEYNDNSFSSKINNFIYSQNEDNNKEKSYTSFINTIVPRTRNLFNLMKKYINSNLSIVSLVNYLEPFLIYVENLTYMQYKDMTKFINDKISQYNKDLVSASILFGKILQIKSAPIRWDQVYTVYSALEDKNIADEIFQGYGIFINNKNRSKTNIEYFSDLFKIDAGKYYFSYLAIISSKLTFPMEFVSLFEERKKKIQGEKSNKEDDKCPPVVIAKKYSSETELQADNNKVIYFDIEFDNTDYTILDNYQNELISMSAEEFVTFLKGKLVKKYKLSSEEGDYLTKTLLDGKKEVKEDQYAVISHFDKGEIKIDYYQRKNNEWQENNDMPIKDFYLPDENILCNLQDNCVAVSENITSKCEPIENKKIDLKEKVLSNMISQFDNQYNTSLENQKKYLRDQFEYLTEKISKLLSIQYHNSLKYNIQKLKLADSLSDEGSVIQSPNQTLLKLILSQGDFVKKQHDIIRFVNEKTRAGLTNQFGINNQKESPHWLYCNKSNIAILPIFKFNLAVKFVNDQPGYKDYLDLLISKVGKLSDNGDYWVDEHSGWPILKIEDDFEEGYDNGFKIVSRSILENDFGAAVYTKEQDQIYDSKQSKTIINILNTIAISMGINLESQKSFVINGVEEALSQTLESEESYNEKVKRNAEGNKRIMSYKDFYNTALLYFSLGMILIAIQTSIPSIRSRKTHPGCIRSFSGYPLEGNGDLSSLEYISCITMDLKSSSEPWYVLKSKKIDFIIKKIKSVIDTVLIRLDNVSNSIKEKTDYLLFNWENKVSEEHNVINWSNFLPPLVKFKLKKIDNIGNDFNTALLNTLRNGSTEQYKLINVLLSKSQYFSLMIQENIQNIVSKEDPIMKKANNTPYVENACCSQLKIAPAINYFIEKDNNISINIKIVKKNEESYNELIMLSKAPLLFSIVDTKLIYPVIDPTYNEDIIYRCFIKYCNFLNSYPVPEYLQSNCNLKPNIIEENKSADISIVIQNLKKDGYNYTYQDLIKLLRNISEKRIIPLTFSDGKSSNLSKLVGYLDSLKDEPFLDCLSNEFLKKIINCIDTYEIALETETAEIKELNNFLIINNEIMEKEIIQFIQKNKHKEPSNFVNKMMKGIERLGSWENFEENKTSDSMANIIEFYKVYLDNIIKIFPTIVLNSVGYTTVIPDYLGLSNSHKVKLKDNIQKYYEPLFKLYGNQKIRLLLEEISKDCYEINHLKNLIPFFSTLSFKDKLLIPIFNERTTIYLYKYMIFVVMDHYIKLSSNPDMLVKVLKSSNDKYELYTEDYLDEQETKDEFVLESDTYNKEVFESNNNELKILTASLLLRYMEIIINHKNLIDIDYSEIEDRAFKLKENEKNMVTDRLQNLTDEMRDIDTLLKKHKLGVWGKGLQKGLTQYVKDDYENEKDLRERMQEAERNIRKNTNNIEGDIEDALEDYMENQRVNTEIENEEYNLNHLGEDYWDDSNYVNYDLNEDE